MDGLPTSRDDKPDMADNFKSKLTYDRNKTEGELKKHEFREQFDLENSPCLFRPYKHYSKPVGLIDNTRAVPKHHLGGAISKGKNQSSKTRGCQLLSSS